VAASLGRPRLDPAGHVQACLVYRPASRHRKTSRHRKASRHRQLSRTKPNRRRSQLCSRLHRNQLSQRHSQGPSRAHGPARRARAARGQAELPAVLAALLGPARRVRAVRGQVRGQATTRSARLRPVWGRHRRPVRAQPASPLSRVAVLVTQDRARVQAKVRARARARVLPAARAQVAAVPARAVVQAAGLARLTRRAQVVRVPVVPGLAR
jgi:hypothetical protein